MYFTCINMFLAIVTGWICREAKNNHFRPAGATRWTDSREIWHMGSLGRAKFHAPIGARGWERGPQNGNNFHFLVKSRPAGANPLTDFYSCLLGAFIQQSILH